jgi:hypothetical protein
MSYQSKKFTFNCEEASYLKLQQLSGKTYFQPKDFQNIIENLINYAHKESNGKKIK